MSKLYQQKIRNKRSTVAVICFIIGMLITVSESSWFPWTNLFGVIILCLSAIKIHRDIDERGWK